MIDDEQVGAWLARLSAPVPEPGGGAAAALVMACSAALVGMVAGYAPPGAERDRLLTLGEELRSDALRRADADGAHSAAIATAFRLAEDVPDRDERIRTATLDGARFAAETALRGLEVPEALHRLDADGAPALRPDIAVAATLLASATTASLVNLRCNVLAARSHGVDERDLGWAHEAEQRARELVHRLEAISRDVTAQLS